MQRFHAAALLPLYNKEATIGRAVGSALASFDHAQRNGALLEPGLVVVVDDGSKDGGAAIVEQMAAQDPRVLLVRQANAGAAAARNTGHAAHKRPWTLLLDADDTWDTGHVLRLARLSDQHPEAGVVANAYRRVDPEGQIQHPDFARSLPQGVDGGEMRRYHHATAYGAMPLSCSSAGVHRDAWQVVGGFPVGISHGEDRIFWSKLSRVTPMAWSPTPSATYHLDAPNRSTATWEPEKARAYLRHLEGTLQGEMHGPRDRRDLETAVRAEHFFLGVRMAQMGFGQDARLHQEALAGLGRPRESAHVAKAIRDPQGTPFRPYGLDDDTAGQGQPKPKPNRAADAHR
jgi:glycosyltransferase involved in cell wall biosynthesis